MRILKPDRRLGIHFYDDDRCIYTYTYMGRNNRGSFLLSTRKIFSSRLYTTSGARLNNLKGDSDRSLLLFSCFDFRRRQPTNQHLPRDQKPLYRPSRNFLPIHGIHSLYPMYILATGRGGGPIGARLLNVVDASVNSNRRERRLQICHGQTVY